VYIYFLNFLFKLIIKDDRSSGGSDVKFFRNFDTNLLIHISKSEQHSPGCAAIGLLHFFKQ